MKFIYSRPYTYNFISFFCDIFYAGQKRLSYFYIYSLYIEFVEKKIQKNITKKTQ